MAAPVHFLPIVTTALSAAFFVVLVRAALVRRSGPHLAWWAFGVFAYGLGTGIESAITLTGNTVALNKAWYVAGALLGGYPLAQGVVYLLLPRRTAYWLTVATVPFIVAASLLVIASPVVPSELDPLRPSGAILAWSWVRLLTPFINLYAFAFLVGGAIVSAVRFRCKSADSVFVRGNALIAVGGVLPGFGGAMAKAGHVEYLYVGEMVGLCLIWLGYTLISRRRTERAAMASVTDHTVSSAQA